jgi:hypothetical protein
MSATTNEVGAKAIRLVTPETQRETDVLDVWKGTDEKRILAYDNFFINAAVQLEMKVRVLEGSLPS